MNREKYSIVFSSLTGNTKKLADTIRAVLPKEDCEYFGTPKAEEELHAEMLYIGFWTDKGNADNATLELLSKLRNKKFFCSGQLASAAVRHIFRKSSIVLRVPLTQAIPWLEAICVRVKCHHLCGSAI